MKRLKGMRGYLARQVNWLLAILLIMIVIRPDVTLRNNRVVITLGPSEAYAAGTADYSLDGLADDVEMQSALNALPNQGGLLHFKAGTYNLTANVTRAIGNVTIEGEGRNTLFTGSGSFVAGGNQWVFRDMALNATTQVDMVSTTGWKWFNVYDSVTFWTVRDSANGISLVSTLNATQLNATNATFTGTVTLSAVTLGGLITSGVYETLVRDVTNSAMLLAGGTSAAGKGAQVILWGSTHGWNGRFEVLTPNAAQNTDVQRLIVSGDTNTAVATWSNTTQTWSSYGAGTLVTDANGVITASSDSRLKNIVGSFTTGLKAILNLSPVKFRWKSTGVNETGQSLNDNVNIYAGLTAQDVMKYIPEAVGQDPSGNYTLDDRVLIVALINSVKELQAQIDALNAQLTNPAYDRSVAPIVGDTGVKRKNVN